MIVEELCPRDFAAWDAYVEAHPRGNCYHLRGWAEAAARAYGHPAPYLVARSPSGSIRGALPLFIIKNPLGRYLTNALFGGYGPILADEPEARRALLEAAVALARRVHASHLTLKVIDEPDCPAGFERQDLGEVAVLSLEGSEAELLRRFRGNTRRAVLKAQTNGLVLRAGAEQLPHFYEVLAENYHRKGTPIYGIAVMRALCAAHPAETEILTLWRGDEVISGLLALYHKDTVYAPFASSRREHFKLFSNYLIYWELMRRARARGIRRLDFGRSPVGSSSMDFKRRFGAVTVPQPHFVKSASGKAASPLRADDPGARRAIALWKRLPRPVADRLGPWLHGHFFA